MRRLDAVAYLADEPRLRQTLREELNAAPDLARALARLALGRGGPRDLGAVRAAIASAHALGASLIARRQRARSAARAKRHRQRLEAARLPASSRRWRARSPRACRSMRATAASSETVRAPISTSSASSATAARQVIAGLQATYAEATGIKSLKVRHNNVLGYFVEVTATNAAALGKPPHRRDVRPPPDACQCHALLDASSSPSSRRASPGRGPRARARARVLSRGSATRCSPSNRRSPRRARRLPSSITMPVSPSWRSSRAMCARRSTASLMFAVEDGRHPMVEQNLRRGDGGSFVGNDCKLGDEEAGDGTRILAGDRTQHGRQVDLPPPERAHRRAGSVGLVRAGARGRNRHRRPAVQPRRRRRRSRPRPLDLHGRDGRDRRDPQSGDARSFVVLDEIGRGTATFDGLSIAWAALEYLHEVNRSRVLFATHYHELTALADKLPRAANATVEVKEWHDEIVFLYRVVQGAADRSYGIHVAKLAGLPPQVLGRASEVSECAGKGRRPAQAVRSRRRSAAVQGGEGAAEPKPEPGLAGSSRRFRHVARRHDPQGGAGGPLPAESVAC